MLCMFKIEFLAKLKKYKNLKFVNKTCFNELWAFLFCDQITVRLYPYTSLKKLFSVKQLFENRTNRWGCSSNGRALALHARGTGFDPPHLHLFFFFFFFFFLILLSWKLQQPL
jgi:hypothetical protein